MTEPRRRWPRVLAGLASGAVLAVTGLAAVGGYFATGLTDNIRAGADGNFQSNEFRPEPGAPINLVLMGSDTREGKNGGRYGNTATIAGARSDTTILLHISGDRQHALAVSIPRDSKVMLPTCKTAGGGTDGAREGRFNEAFEIGGPGCTVKAIKELTGVPIDHYVVMDFTGFKGIVDAMNGVEICLKEPVVDEKALLDLPAGRQVVRGEQALAFVRARYALGDGSDISRIERQQDFLSSAIRKATSMEIVSNPTTLYAVLSAGTKSITTDPGLANFDAIKDLAINVSGVKPSEVVFATVPFSYNDDGGTVSWVDSQANELWNAIKLDQTWPPPPTDGVDGRPLVAAPKDITVNVENGSGVTGQGKRLAADLTAEGFTVGSVTTAKTDGPSQILFNPAVAQQVEAARTLQIATGVTPTPTSTQKGNAVTMIVGSDFAFIYQPVRVQAAKPTGTAAAAKARTAEKSVCAS